MTQSYIKIIAAAMPLLLASCATRHYTVSSVERSRILIDSSYDSHIDAEVTSFMQPYSKKVNEMMSPVMGTAACDMARCRPESPLSNLLADILVWSSDKFDEHPDFAVYNMGGIRAALSKGKVTRGDILDVAPFENKICFLTLSGKDVLTLFQQMAAVGGEAVSRSVCLHITADGKLVSAAINGKPIDADASYRIATLDYLAQGNDRMEAFKLKTNVKAPTAEQNNVRFLIEEYFKAEAAAGRSVAAKVEGRIVVDK